MIAGTLGGQMLNLASARLARVLLCAVALGALVAVIAMGGSGLAV